MALLPATVYAHARLVTSVPAPGSLLEHAPVTIDLHFSEAVTPVGRGITVYGPDGRQASGGPATARGSLLSVPFAGTSQGTYAVVWTVIASDTHPSRGSFIFSIGRVSPVSAPGLGEPDVGLVSPLGLVLQALSRWVHFAGFALGVGAATYSLFVARSSRTTPLAGAGVVLLLVAEPLALLAQSASLDPTRVFDGDTLTSILVSPFGRVLGLRVGAALLLWAVLGALRQAPRLRWAIPTLGVALALVDAAATHATPALPQPLGLGLNALHVFVMGIWVGGLAAFAVEPSGGFGRIAIWTAALLILSGAALALLHFGQWRELITTGYGVSLMIKLPLVAVALYMARLGRRRLELVALMLVLAATALLVSLPPPR